VELEHLTRASDDLADLPDTSLGESRWPPVLAMFVFLLMNVAVRIWLPDEGPAQVPWLLPTVEGILVAAALWATALLVADLIRGTGGDQLG
jgi:hypothetical protein